VGCASSGTYAVPVAGFENAVNAEMAELCASNHVPAESLTFYGLSGFRDY
jgi:hypothetical protein